MQFLESISSPSSVTCACLPTATVPSPLAACTVSSHMCCLLSEISSVSARMAAHTFLVCAPYSRRAQSALLFLPSFFLSFSSFPFPSSLACSTARCTSCIRAISFARSVGTAHTLLTFFQMLFFLFSRTPAFLFVTARFGLGGSQRLFFFFFLRFCSSLLP